MLAATQHQVTVGDLRIGYHCAGEGPAVLLIHGSGPGTTAWSTFGDTLGLLSRHFRVVAPDMPGWGESSAVEFDPRVQLDAIRGFMDALGLESAFVVGHSLGGARAIDVAAAEPDRVPKLVLLAAPAPGRDIMALGPSPGSRTLFEAYRSPSAATIGNLLAAILHDQRLVTPELVTRSTAAALAYLHHHTNFIAGVGRPGYSLFAHADPVMALGRITASTLIVHGRNDTLISIESALRLLTSIDDTRALLVNRCGHWPHVERRREWERALLGFLLDEATQPTT